MQKDKGERITLKIKTDFQESSGAVWEYVVFFYCMFYQLFHVQHGCSSTQSWSSVLPSIVETRVETRIPGVAPFSFQIGIWDLFCADRNPIHQQPLGSCGPLQELDLCYMPHHNPWPLYETEPQIEPGSFGLADEWSTSELTLYMVLLTCWCNVPPTLECLPSNVQLFILFSIQLTVQICLQT